MDNKNEACVKEAKENETDVKEIEKSETESISNRNLNGILLIITCLLPGIASVISVINPIFWFISSAGLGIITCMLVFLMGTFKSDTDDDEKMFNMMETDMFVKVIIGIVLFELVCVFLSIFVNLPIQLTK